jgi:hypothetical protein
MVAGSAEELKGYCDRVLTATDGDATLFLLEGLRLPEGCSPQKVDGLLCPLARDGYPSRLYFSTSVNCPFGRNWNTMNKPMAGRLWNAFSWKVEPAGLSLAQLLLGHLEAFTRA